MSRFDGWIVGLDCAAQPERFGIAVARYSAGKRLLWVDAWQGRRGQSIAATVATRLHAAAAHLGSPSGDLLIALDAPLGWPASLGAELAVHEAGQPILHDSNRLFRRHTDEVIQARLGKRPLEVGADRIARAAVEALFVLQELRAELGVALPLPRSSGWGNSSCPATAPWRASAAIEVYPAALLTVLGLPARMYKRPAQQAVRRAILNGLASTGYQAVPNGIADGAVRQPDVLDSILCVCSGVEFLNGRVIEPEDDTVLEKEGWAWVPDPDIPRTP